MSLHASVAWFVLHTVPHAPQLLVVVIDVSQPLATLPSQLPKPAEHVISQVEFTHVPTPPAWLHLLPQLPQLFGSVAVSTSQPFVVFPSQFAKFLLHAMEHAEAAQVAVPFALPHAFPQLPQSFTSSVMLVSQPFDVLVSQLAKSFWQLLTTHLEASHASDPFSMEHLLPHVAQFCVSYATLSSQPFDAFMSQSA